MRSAGGVDVAAEFIPPRSIMKSDTTVKGHPVADRTLVGAAVPVGATKDRVSIKIGNGIYPGRCPSPLVDISGNDRGAEYLVSVLEEP